MRIKFYFLLIMNVAVSCSNIKEESPKEDSNFNFLTVKEDSAGMFFYFQIKNFSRDTFEIPNFSEIFFTKKSLWSGLNCGMKLSLLDKYSTIEDSVFYTSGYETIIMGKDQFIVCNSLQKIRLVNSSIILRLKISNLKKLKKAFILNNHEDLIFNCCFTLKSNKSNDVKNMYKEYCTRFVLSEKNISNTFKNN